MTPIDIQWYLPPVASSKDDQIAIRIARETSRRVEELKESRRQPAAAVAREALLRGLELLEREGRGLPVLSVSLEPNPEESYRLTYCVRRLDDGRECLVRCSLDADLARLLRRLGMSDDIALVVADHFYQRQIPLLARDALQLTQASGVQFSFGRAYENEFGISLREVPSLVQLTPDDEESDGAVPCREDRELSRHGVLIESDAGKRCIAAFGARLVLGERVRVQFGNLHHPQGGLAAHVAHSSPSPSPVLLDLVDRPTLPGLRLAEDPPLPGSPLRLLTSTGATIDGQIEDSGANSIRVSVDSDGYPPALAEGSAALCEGRVVGVAQLLLYSHQAGRRWTIDIARLSPELIDSMRSGSPEVVGA